MVIPTRWKDSVLQRVEEGSCWVPGTKGTRLIIDGCPEMIAEIKRTLLNLRRIGLPVNASTSRNIIMAYMTVRQPTLFLVQPSVDVDLAILLSIHTVRRFLSRELNWVVRCGTKAAQKVSGSWEEDCLKTFYRLMLLIVKHEVHPSLVVNPDQTGVLLVPGGSQRTNEVQGSQQVAIHGKEEKRPFTVVVATSMDVKVLPTQSVYKGKTEVCLPGYKTSERPFAIAKGHRFVTNPKNHWSSLVTTKLWFESILLPYRMGYDSRAQLAERF